MTRRLRGGCLAVAVLLASALGCGSGLEGEPGGPVSDWSFVRDAESVEFGAADGTPLRFVLAHPLVVDGRLYLRALTVFPLEHPALDAILEEGRARVAVDGRVWELRAVRLTKAEEIDPLLPELLRQSHMVATGAHWDPTPARYPGTQVKQWFLRLEQTRG